MRSEGGMKVMAWVMLGAVVFGLGGYGVTNFGGQIGAVGTVGDQTISARAYARALQRELDTYRKQIGKDLTPQQALQLGIDSQVQQQLVTEAALDNEDDRLGISVGNTALREAIQRINAFQGPGGGFDKTAYSYVLSQNGYTVADFETQTRQQMTRTILQQAIGGMVPAPKAYVDTIVAYLAEERSFDMLKITAADLPNPVPAPTDAELQAYYKAHAADFTQPEAKVLTYVALTPDMLAATVKLDDATLKALYDKNKATYSKPETRKVDRLAFPSEAEAQAAKAALDAGTKTFDQLVADRGLTAANVAMGSVTQDRLSTTAGAAVFGLKAPGVVGPVASAVGPAIFRVDAITPASTETFDEVKSKLGADLRTQKAVAEIGTRAQAISDKLAAGATLQDLVKEEGMQLGHMDFTAGDTTGMAAYPAFRDAAAKVKQGDYPTLIQLKDGGVAALQMDSLRKAEVIPFDKVADKVKAGWTAEATTKALKARAEEIAAKVKGGADLASFGTVEKHPAILRSGFIEGVAKTLLPAIFKLQKPGELTTAEEGDAAWVAKLDKIVPADPKNPDVVKLRGEVEKSAQQGIATDGFDMFATAVISGTPVKLDKTAIAAANSQAH
ncbi:MAG: SurA N-terminal domain-containing protein [Paracoccaceae bacterium]|nr:SurA N-terminal domain-containing protein [Paracoccaceae bacterium]